MDDARTPHPPTASADGGGSLCRRFTDALTIDGASIAVFGLGGQQLTLCATDAVAARSDALQLELGEGPHWDAVVTRQPVLCPDLGNPDHALWPLYTAAALQLGIMAVFAFPITLGAATVGAVDLQSFGVRHLDVHDVALATTLASDIAATVVRRATAAADDPDAPEHGMVPALRREVHQATGMIQAQLGVTATEAFARLRAHAFSTERAIEDIARDVVGRILDFSTLTD